jgi:hypothetical protein
MLLVRRHPLFRGEYAKKSVKIQEIRELMAEYGATRIENVDIESLRDIREAFESPEDKRFEPYAEHLLPDIVMITLIGVLANGYVVRALK